MEVVDAALHVMFYCWFSDNFIDGWLVVFGQGILQRYPGFLQEAVHIGSVPSSRPPLLGPIHDGQWEFPGHADLQKPPPNHG